jgi:hypothetical protein
VHPKDRKREITRPFTRMSCVHSSVSPRPVRRASAWVSLFLSSMTSTRWRQLNYLSWRHSTWCSKVVLKLPPYYACVSGSLGFIGIIIWAKPKFSNNPSPMTEVYFILFVPKYLHGISMLGLPTRECLW